MQRLFSVGSVVSITLVAIAAFPAAAHSLPTKKEAAYLLAKAEEQVRITKPGSPPFHLVAKLRYVVGADSLDGTYEVLWAAPDRFREEFRLGGLTETDVVLGDKRYILRDTPYLSYPLWAFRHLAGLYGTNVPPAPSKVGSVYAGPPGPQATVCIEVKSLVVISPTYCLDASTGQVVSKDYRVGRGKEQKRLPPEMDGYTNVGAGRYPQHILLTAPNERQEILVEKIELVERFADNVFEPPAGVSPQDWCPRPDIGKLEGTTVKVESLLRGLNPPGSHGLHIFYYKVARDGQIEVLAEFNRDGTLKLIPQRHLGDSRFAVHSCSGKPIEYEDITTTWQPPDEPELLYQFLQGGSLQSTP